MVDLLQLVGTKHTRNVSLTPRLFYCAETQTSIQSLEKEMSVLRKREELARKEADTSSREKGLQLQVCMTTRTRQNPRFARAALSNNCPVRDVGC